MASTSGIFTDGYLPGGPPEDLDEELTQYWAEPRYTMGRAGIDPIARPTGGRLVFRCMPAVHNLTRKILGTDFKDFISLTELVNVMKNQEGKATDMYRAMLTGGSFKIDPMCVAESIRPFGVTSISMCKEWHKDYMATAQPILIYGASHVDRTSYTKQDTLRLPVSMCEIDSGKSDEDTRRYVYMTFRPPSGFSDWQLKFVVTPSASYENREMIREMNYSLVYPLGILDFLNHGSQNTDIYMFKSADGKEEPHWYLEGFVYNPSSNWKMTYDGSPVSFYSNNGADMKDVWRMLTMDPMGDAFMDFIQENGDELIADKVIETEEGSEEEGDGGESALSGKRKRPISTFQGETALKRRRTYNQKPKRRRFYGGGVLSTAIASLNPVSPETSMGQGDDQEEVIPRFTPIAPSRSLEADTPDAFRWTRENRLVFSLSKKEHRTISTNQLSTVMYHFNRTGSAFIHKLDAYVSTAMKNKVITAYRLVNPGDAINVTAMDAFLILAMSFLGRLKVEGGRHASSAAKSMSMDKLFAYGQIEKLKCLVNYFIKALEPQTKLFDNNRQITFMLKPAIHGDAKNPIVPPLAALKHSKGIEDVKGAVHADFANKWFGGGVFSEGAVQEEILLITTPEALVGRALIPPLKDAETAMVLGAVRMSDHSGYGRRRLGRAHFVFTASADTDAAVSTLDQQQRALASIVAFDAINYEHSVRRQYEESAIKRAFHKATSAFSEVYGTDVSVPVATGKWGAGAFMGDPLLNSLIQIAAASYTKRPIVLLQMGAPLVYALDEIIRGAVDNKMTVSDFMDTIVDILSNIPFTYNNQENERKSSRALLGYFKKSTQTADQVEAHLDIVATKDREDRIKHMQEVIEETRTDEPEPEEEEAEQHAPPPGKQKRRRKKQPVAEEAASSGSTGEEEL